MIRTFTFKREAHWLLVLVVLLPLIGMVLAFAIPWLGRQGWW
jgi:hypothetical protein